MTESDLVDEEKQEILNIAVIEDYNVGNEQSQGLESCQEPKEDPNQHSDNSSDEDIDIDHYSLPTLAKGIRHISRHCSRLSLTNNVQKFAGKYDSFYLLPNFAFSSLGTFSRINNIFIFLMIIFCG